MYVCVYVLVTDEGSNFYYNYNELVCVAFFYYYYFFWFFVSGILYSSKQQQATQE